MPTSWNDFANITPSPNTTIVDGQPILATQITAVYSRADVIFGWFKNGLPDKLSFTSPDNGAAFRLISTGSNPGTLSVGDVWRVGEEIRFRANDTTTKTLAFTDSSFTTITASGNVSAGGTLSATGDTTLSSSTTIKSNLNDTLKVVRTSTDKTKFSVNALGSTVHIGDGTTFSVYSGDVGTGNATFSVTPAGAVTASGNATISGNLQVDGTSSVAGTLNVTGNISRNSVAYALPYRLNAGGFTVNIGNASTVIATGAQQPIVIIPYQATIEACTIVTTEVSGSITVELQKKSGTAANTWTAITSTLDLSAANTANAVTPTVSAAAGQSLVLAEGDILRLNVTAVSTLKSAAIHFRVRRNTT